LGEKNTAPTTGRVLGLDVGERRIGVAISDPERRFAVPLRSIDRRESQGHEVEAIGERARSEDVTELVVGLPLSMSGEEGTQAQVTREFADKLAVLGMPVRFWDERLSSHEAEMYALGPQKGRDAGRRSGRDKQRAREADTDAIAASIILQAFLDHERLNPGGPL
jgi:putative Holliday junction resolvase